MKTVSDYYFYILYVQYFYFFISMTGKKIPRYTLNSLYNRVFRNASLSLSGGDLYTKN